jgi:hypothetical protein
MRRLDPVADRVPRQAPPLAYRHLPLKGEIGSFKLTAASVISVPDESMAILVISPLEGEMAGRPEGGVVLVRLLIA